VFLKRLVRFTLIDFADARDWLIKQFIHPVLQPHLKNLKTRSPAVGIRWRSYLQGDRCYLRVSVLPRVDESSLICDSGLCRQNLVEFERQIKSGEFILPAAQERSDF